MTIHPSSFCLALPEQGDFNIKKPGFSLGPGPKCSALLSSVVKNHPWREPSHVSLCGIPASFAATLSCASTVALRQKEACTLVPNKSRLFRARQNNLLLPFGGTNSYLSASMSWVQILKNLITRANFAKTNLWQAGGPCQLLHAISLICKKTVK